MDTIWEAVRKATISILNKNLQYCYTVTLNYELKIDDKFQKLPPQHPSHTHTPKKERFFCVFMEHYLENKERKHTEERF